MTTTVIAGETKPAKPLKAKAYGSIGHLPQSRLGPGDWHVHEGQARICCEKPRKGDRIIVTEKLDGACMSVANIGGEIVSLSRAGYRADDALYPHLKAFAPFVAARHKVFAHLLAPGERICGEWLSMAHGTMYDASHPGFAPFIAFDIFRDGKRILRDEFAARCGASNIPTAHLIHDGPAPLSVAAALASLGPFGQHGASEPVEGAVWRVEREGAVDFLAKYVRPDKIDGKYLPGLAASLSTEPVWLWRDDMTPLQQKAPSP
jgi:hypothetical protein